MAGGGGGEEGVFPSPGLERGRWETSRTSQGQSSGFHTGHSEDTTCTADASKH